jgi:hypothetical protein
MCFDAAPKRSISRAMMTEDTNRQSARVNVRAVGIWFWKGDELFDHTGFEFLQVILVRVVEF